MKDQKARACLSLFQAIYGCDSDDEDDEASKEDQAKKAEDKERLDDHDEDIPGFLSMIGSSLKRLGGGIVGAHRSLIYCQIQYLLLKPHFYALILHVFMDLPWLFI